MSTANSVSLHSLPQVVKRGKKRLGRGYGSGKGGHTSSRGQKGQRSRRTIPWSFEGGNLPLSQRLPFWRGKGRLRSLKEKPATVNLGQLEKLADGVVIDGKLLVTEGFVSEEQLEGVGVKILARGKLTKKLTIVGLPVSSPARSKIEAAGGSVGTDAPPPASKRASRKQSAVITKKTPSPKKSVINEAPRKKPAAKKAVPAKVSLKKKSS